MNSRNRQPKTPSYKTPLVLFCRGKCWWPLFFWEQKKEPPFFTSNRIHILQTGINRTQTGTNNHIVKKTWKLVGTPFWFRLQMVSPSKHLRDVSAPSSGMRSELLLSSCWIPLWLAARRIYPPHPGCGFFVIFRDDGKTHIFKGNQESRTKTLYLPSSILGGG